MKMEHEPAKELGESQPARSRPEITHPVRLVALEEVLERTRVRFTADVQAFRAELHQRLQVGGSAPPTSGSAALAHQATRAVRPAHPAGNAAEQAVAHGRHARVPTAPGPQRQRPAAAAPTPGAQVQPQRSGWWDQYRYVVVLWIICLIVGLGLGVVLALLIR